MCSLALSFVFYCKKTKISRYLTSAATTQTFDSGDLAEENVVAMEITALHEIKSHVKTPNRQPWGP